MSVKMHTNTHNTHIRVFILSIYHKFHHNTNIKKNKEMGLGKTLQTISLLAYLASYKGIWGPHLVIVPTSVIINWETELKRFCPALKVLCYYGTSKRRKELRTGWTKVKRQREDVLFSKVYSRLRFMCANVLPCVLLEY